MKKLLFGGLGPVVASICLFVLPERAGAQFFSYSGTGDVLAGFRKTGTHQGTYEVVVNLGNITNFLAVSQGSSLPLPNLSSNLASAFPEGNQDLQWSVFSTFSSVSSWSTPLGSFPPASIWYTLARTNAGSPTQPQPRLGFNNQVNARQPMLGVGYNATTISTDLGTNDANNNASLVVEPVSGNASLDLSASIESLSDATVGNFNDALGFSVENMTPDTFSSPVASDLYQSCPASAGGRGGGTYLDPITGLTNGCAYLVGSFTLNPNGTMSFVRASTNAVVTPPPPVPSVASYTRTGTTTTISFGTTNGATYTLHYTNAAGLTAPVSTWPTTTNLTGDGTVRSIIDVTSDPNRFYRIGAH